MRVTTWTEFSLILSIHLTKRGLTGFALMKEEAQVQELVAIPSSL